MSLGFPASPENYCRGREKGCRGREKGCRGRKSIGIRLGGGYRCLFCYFRTEKASNSPSCKLSMSLLLLPDRKSIDIRHLAGYRCLFYSFRTEKASNSPSCRLSMSLLSLPDRKASKSPSCKLSMSLLSLPDRKASIFAILQVIDVSFVTSGPEKHRNRHLASYRCL